MSNSVTEEILRFDLLDMADVALAIGTSQRTVLRWSTEGIPPRRKSADRLLELRAVLDLAVQTLPKGSVLNWLRGPVPALDYGKPLELIRDGDFRRVIAALQHKTAETQ
jgi:hypothetical protein